MNRIYKTLILTLIVQLAFGQQVKKATSGSFLLQNGMVHTVTNGIIEADVFIENNQIVHIAPSLANPQAEIIDCSGLHIYPGLIDGGTKLGLAEIKSISLSKDYNEHGQFTPHMDALTAVNPNSVNIPVTRVNGVTTVLTKPEGNMFPGSAALIHLQGYTPNQMFAGKEFQVFEYPRTGKRGSRDKRTKKELEADKDKKFESLNDFWDQVVLHAQIDSAASSRGTTIDYNPQLDALKDVVRGNEKLLVVVNKKADILDAIIWVHKHQIDAIFSGVAEGWKVADSLAKYDIPVITGPVLSLPSRDSDRFDRAYANAGIMQKAGVLVAIQTNQVENVRNLPFNAGFAANYGMGKEEALKAVTINPAKIFGVDDQIGSIEKGKIANIIVCDGDPFETKTQIQYLFINGWKMPLESRHTLLYDEFLERNPGTSN